MNIYPPSPPINALVTTLIARNATADHVRVDNRHSATQFRNEMKCIILMLRVHSNIEIFIYWVFHFIPVDNFVNLVLATRYHHVAI